ncbi:MBL fold metallo-hydrolase [Polycladomyces sp. WAk]|uniref:MBL fold metallo-hydrolase n=1 Tax=Polycladomyces zharkentensis TaxID=2807616 RepID=A0ABS2WJD9_9BACL|nr:MBL fold metallo-hydrolase [Polycladomyces sp. WAk]MBN2909576.1 MBL fold metallo-hydrolase [Polycladomyces sp. WAk]
MAVSNIPVITTKELHEKIASGKPIFILDVRNEDEYANWKIEGKHVASINVPYFAFVEEDESIWESIPNDVKDIVVVCAKGGASEFVAEQLRKRGYNAVSLEGGMLAWSQFYQPELVAFDENLKLYQVNRLAKGCLSYVLISEGEALIVDPSRHIDVYLELVQKEGAVIRHIADTHVHADHISGGPELAKRTGATYYLPSSDVQDGTVSFEPLENHSQIRMGKVIVEVLAIPTPGHTPGSTSLLVNKKHLLSGDTIFVGGLGRPDLGGKAKEWAQMLYDTVFTTIANLSDDVYVLPAHYADVQEINERGIVGAPLGDIRRSNEIMRTQDREAFTETVAASAQSEKPPNFETIVDINRGLKEVTADEANELELGPNRCAVHHSTPNV